jgi:hypothetical protein
MSGVKEKPAGIVIWRKTECYERRGSEEKALIWYYICPMCGAALHTIHLVLFDWKARKTELEIGYRCVKCNYESWITADGSVGVHPELKCVMVKVRKNEF